MYGTTNRKDVSSGASKKLAVAFLNMRWMMCATHGGFP
jgi:hypothetical protein